MYCIYKYTLVWCTPAPFGFKLCTQNSSGSAICEDYGWKTMVWRKIQDCSCQYANNRMCNIGAKYEDIIIAKNRHWKWRVRELGHMRDLEKAMLTGNTKWWFFSFEGGIHYTFTLTKWPPSSVGAQQHKYPSHAPEMNLLIFLSVFFFLFSLHKAEHVFLQLIFIYGNIWPQIKVSWYKYERIQVYSWWSIWFMKCFINVIRYPEVF